MKGNGRVLNAPLVFSGKDGVIGGGTVFFKSDFMWKPGGSVYVCPYCGEVWGKVKTDSYYEQRHQPVSIPCASHGGGVFSLDVSKSEYLDFDLEYSAEVLKQDFCTMYDNWFVKGVEPAEESFGLGESTLRTATGKY